MRVSSSFENIFARILYFHNTIDSHFVIMGIASSSLAKAFMPTEARWAGWPHFIIYSVCATAFLYAAFKIADFYPLFLLGTPLFVFLASRAGNFSGSASLILLAVVVVLFFLTQFLTIGVAYIVILRDLTTPLRVAVNSLFTIAPTTTSFVISVYFTYFLAYLLIFQPNPFTEGVSLLLAASILVTSLLTRLLLPKTKISLDNRPIPTRRRAERVVLLNIDGCRLDAFDRGSLPFISELKKKGAWYRHGAMTVYRALTNPAFASMLTGVPPRDHGILDNNIRRSIRIEGIPDIVETILYGSIHVKHFSKKNWRVRTISILEHGFDTDDILFLLLKEDISREKSTRLFIADLSNLDMAGHAYGSYSKVYAQQMVETDRRIRDFFEWLEGSGLFESTAVIITSDHGITITDHSYLIFKSELYVPLVLCGAGVKHASMYDNVPSIMDICPTISYIMGIAYPRSARGRVLLEALI